MSSKHISLVIPGNGPRDFVESPTYTPSCSSASASASSNGNHNNNNRKRRSLINIPSSLIPGRGKFHKFWPAGSRRSTCEGELKDWNGHHTDVSEVIRLAGVQMGALGNPANAMSPSTGGVRQDEKRRRHNEFEERVVTRSDNNKVHNFSRLPPYLSPPPPPLNRKPIPDREPAPFPPPPPPVPMHAPPRSLPRCERHHLALHLRRRRCLPNSPRTSASPWPLNNATRWPRACRPVRRSRGRPVCGGPRRRSAKSDSWSGRRGRSACRPLRASTECPASAR